MITFKSRATASVMMFDEVGKRLLDIMGKTYSPEGIITVAQLPLALAQLKDAAEHDRARSRHDQKEDEDEDTAAPPRPIGLSQRAAPLIDLLTQSLQADEPVIWG